jgi:hypothetical protein
MWISALRRLADPVLTNLANATLRRECPLSKRRCESRVGHALEALGRLVAGIAPWIELPRMARLKASFVHAMPSSRGVRFTPSIPRHRIS